jgi:hypothetical protein
MNGNPYGKHTCIEDSTSCPIQLGGVHTWCHCFLDAVNPDCSNNAGPATKQHCTNGIIPPSKNTSAAVDKNAISIDHDTSSVNKSQWLTPSMMMIP